MFDSTRTQPSLTHDQNDWKFVTKDQTPTQNHDTSLVNQCKDEGFVLLLRPNTQNQEPINCDDSGVCSPPLWKKPLSPKSRQQAIARGQWELMEMVKNMPESSYELSLKDLVEIQAPQVKNNDINLHQRLGVKVKRQESKGYEKNIKMRRSGSFENKGLFLNMVFPFHFRSKKKRKSFRSDCSERDRWKKKFRGSSDSNSSRTSINSGSTASCGGSSGGRSFTGERYVGESVLYVH